MVGQSFHFSYTLRSSVKSRELDIHMHEQFPMIHRAWCRSLTVFQKEIAGPRNAIGKAPGS